MTALISAAATGTLKATETPTYQPIMTPPEAPNQPENTEKVSGAPRIGRNNAQGLIKMVIKNLTLFTLQNNLTNHI